MALRGGLQTESGCVGVEGGRLVEEALRSGCRIEGVLFSESGERHHERLAPLIDTTHRWDRELSQDEQLCLALARILLQTPPWLLIDGTFGSLDDDVLELVIDVFTNELSHTGVIHIGGPGQAHPLFTRVLHLVKNPGARNSVTAVKEPGSHE